MQKKIITVGDTNSSGGKVISGSTSHTIMGRAIARMGDKVDCPGRYPDGSPHGVNPIVEGVENFPIDGVPVAVEGFKSECGCTLVGSQTATTVVGAWPSWLSVGNADNAGHAHPTRRPAPPPNHCPAGSPQAQHV